MGTKTSEHLTPGSVYSRAQLKNLFEISDATINTGVFRPLGSDSVWLFITENKTADRTQYEDRLDGDDLYFEGQMAGRTDHLITRHEELGLELLLFYRRSKAEHPDFAFRYEGVFSFIESTLGPPTRFQLRRMSAQIPVTLQVVTDAAQVRENVRRFGRDMSLYHQWAIALIGKTIYWVVDDDQNGFGPSKFVGFRDMTFPKYNIALTVGSQGAPFQGGVTRAAVESVLGEFAPDADAAQRLHSWCVERLGEDSLAGIDTSKWLFARLPSPRNYWALLCNPNRFAALEAASVLDGMVWTVNRGEPQPGDRVLVWQAKGSGMKRGVVALAEVTQGVAPMDTPAEERPFWREPPPGIVPRIHIRIIRLPGLPIWEDDMPELANLAVARATGGTVFSVEPSQWHAVARRASGTVQAVEDALESVPEGQGFVVDAAVRRAIERHAQRMAEEHFISRGFAVSDVSKGNPYDLRCERSGEEVRVEVKGTTGEGETVFLTRNEVEHARANRHRMALAVVRRVEVESRNGVVTTRGGELRVIWPWDVDLGVLTPMQFQLHVPAT